MRANKAMITVVIGLGAVIVLLFAAIGYGFVRKAADPGFRMFAKSEPGTPPKPQALTGPPEVPILLAPGTHLLAWEANDGKLILHIQPASGGDELIVIDISTGRVIRRVVVRTQQ